MSSREGNEVFGAAAVRTAVNPLNVSSQVSVMAGEWQLYPDTVLGIKEKAHRTWTRWLPETEV